jgi:cation:H+ antiporter
MLWFYLLIFLISLALLTFSGRWLVDALSKIAKFLGWKEFVVAFFLTAFSVSLPNFFVGIISAFNKVPELSFGDVVGGNVVELTLIVALGALVSKAGLSARSRTAQGTSIFTIFMAILPLILASDGSLSRVDGFLLFLGFLGYVFWLFQKKERFEKIYNGILEPKGLKFFFKNLIIFLVSTILLLSSAQGIVKSALFFSNYFKLSLSLVGILIVSLGNSIPDVIFVSQAARKSEDWLILGDLMGGVIITATLVLGIVSLISPIKITNFPAIMIGRVFLIISVLFFFFFIRTDRKITKKEAIILLGIYLTFVVVEMLSK